ncbi:hypothetical protein [Flavobacterium sp. 7A]|uniref:hypothetical protein n=1 Tax=Flavobacterium sp. 7A TaxID=2940571 RepID=UPI0022273D4E|nr:hypothetical protein [Flavobacterium sp. 7A]MCW2121063.1 DNA-binding NtrC family response regulator [Flavobacterium sp. 7A]
MKIAVFENEYESVKGSFETANLVDFNNELDVHVYPSSQLANLLLIDQFSVIFIDIDLSTKSELDGFGLIKKLDEISNLINKKIIILTGNNKIEDALKSRNIKSDIYHIIIKPTNFLEISKAITRVTNPR